MKKGFANIVKPIKLWWNYFLQSLIFARMDTTASRTIISKETIAAALVFLGAIFFSSKAVLVKLAYRYEIDSISLLTLRMVFSLPIFLIIAWFSNKSKESVAQPLSLKDWFYILVLGIAGYYLASLFDFMGLQYVTASMERLILFVYPTLVLVISAIFLGKKIKGVQYGALALTYFGIVIAFLEGLAMDGQKDFIRGGILVFVSALTYAIYLIGSGNLLPRMGTLRYTSFTMSAACLTIIVHHGVVYQWDLFDFPAEVYWLSIVMAVFATVLPSFLISEGIRVIGSGNASIIGSIGPVSTIVLAYIFLGERLGWLQWLGTVFVIGGVLLISLSKKTANG